MTKELFSLNVAAVIAVSLIFMAGSAKAEPYPWCAVYGAYAARNCGFVTLEQCMATVSGIGGSCEPNQFYTGRPAPEHGRTIALADIPTAAAFVSNWTKAAISWQLNDLCLNSHPAPFPVQV